MKYKTDPRAVGVWLKTDRGLNAELKRRAHLGLAVGRALAPRRTGALAASGKIVDDGLGGVNRDRMQVSVVFDEEYTAAVTFDKRRRQQITRAYLFAVKAVIEAGS